MSRRTTRIGLVVATFVVVLVGLVGWRVWQVRQALTGAEGAASALESAIRDGDDPAADRAQADLEREAGEAADATDGYVWSALRGLPLVGDDADAIRLAATSLDVLARDAVPALREVAAQRDDLLPSDGRVPLERVAGLARPVARAELAVDASVDSLDRVDAASLLGPLEDRWRDLVDRLRQARSDLAAARAAIDLLPPMLGEDGTRRLLLVFENNAEIRATGGLPGSAAELVATDGRLTLGRQVAGSDLISPTPVLPLTAAERRIYGPRLATDFRQANWTPDFPRSAALWEANWNSRFPAEPVDGVVTLDPIALSYLLRATGPISVGGVELTSENAADELLSTVYARIPDPPDQDAFFQEAASTIFTRLTSGVDDSAELLGALSQGVAEGRIRVQSAVPAEQEELARFAIAGELPTEASSHPRIGVYLVDATGSKMSYYLRSAVRVQGASCVDGVQRLDVTLTLSSTLAPDQAAGLPDYVAGDYEEIALDRGDQVVAVRLYGPIGGGIAELAVDDGDAAKAKTVDDQGRAVATTYVVVPPGEEKTISWRVLGGEGQAAAPQVDLTPGVVDSRIEIPGSAC